MTDELLRRLLNRKTETRNLDYKEAFNWFSSTNDQKCEIIKEILGMLNTQDGGRIVIGVAVTTILPSALTSSLSSHSIQPRLTIFCASTPTHRVPARCTNI